MARRPRSPPRDPRLRPRLSATPPTDKIYNTALTKEEEPRNPEYNPSLCIPITKSLIEDVQSLVHGVKQQMETNPLIPGLTPQIPHDIPSIQDTLDIENRFSETPFPDGLNYAAPGAKKRRAPPLPRFRCICSYDAAEDDEMTVTAGEMFVLCEEGVNDWNMVTNIETGQAGLVPKTFLHMIG